MFPDLNIYSSPILFLSLQGLLFCFLLATRFFKKKNEYYLYLGLILLITCYDQTAYILGFMGWYDTFRNTKINYFLLNLNLALGPLIFLLIRSICVPKKTFSLKDLLHFIPLLVVVLVKILIYLADRQQANFHEVQNGDFVINFQWPVLDPLAFIILVVQMAIYLYLAFKMLNRYREKIKHFFSNTFQLELNWLYIFLIIYTLLFSYNIIQEIVGRVLINLSWTQSWWYFLFSGVVIIYVGIRGYFTDLSKLQEAEVKEFLDESPSEKIIKNTPVNEKIKERLTENKTRLNRIMSDEKPYLDPNITLVTLAKKVKLSREELSETLNKGLGLRFNDYINQYRITEFCELLKQGRNKHLSLVGIAYECGFNSKSTFNRAFKKAKNLSPSEFLQTIVNQ